ncbi:hypothetical protein CQ12_25285 [Bradyrhizobium jicamae]|uniref:Uncharacterized protein n=1 Tax=Bradyrhizobium jicamae TaxID=280332 RepID=A0A0R3LJI2_9BRAD|nr:hypothetical protein [Bradyrhizobium jicamae]KRR07916.1 hypothetical protein CQ12_25285 [Bradyrhizobium jicamae]
MLGLAHTIGEFGLVLMIGGNSRTVSVLLFAIFDYVKASHRCEASWLAAGMVVFAAVLLTLSWLLSARRAGKRSGQRCAIFGAAARPLWRAALPASSLGDRFLRHRVVKSHEQVRTTPRSR